MIVTHCVQGTALDDLKTYDLHFQAYRYGSGVHEFLLRLKELLRFDMLYVY